MLGEVTPGGPAPASTGCSIFALLAVFIAGLMVGRTPEYLGKKIQATEMKLVVALHPRRADARSSASRDLGRARPSPKSSILNPGAHGLSEVVYAFTSAANNNGSAFGGLTGQHRLVQHDARPARCSAGRFLPIVLVLGARRLARAQAAGAAVRRHVPDRHAALRRRCSSASILDRRRAHVLPRSSRSGRSWSTCSL